MADPVDVVILTVIRPELSAAQAALKLEKHHKEQGSGIVSWHGAVESVAAQRRYNVVLSCIGIAGNPAAASMATELLTIYKPRALLLMGIAAGVRGKIQIGDVVLSERVVAYEPAALVARADGTSSTVPRPEMDRIPTSMQQDVVNYDRDTRRINDLFRQIGGRVPSAPKGADKSDWQKEIAKKVGVRDATIASGEKLLRDPGKLIELRERGHGRIEVGEMEAVGIVEACRRHSVPWLIIRGISDYGDEFKDDRFHDFASRRAAAVMADFLAHGLRLEPISPVAAKRGHEGGPSASMLPSSDGDGHPHRTEFDQLCKALAVASNQMMELIAPPWSRKRAVLEELRQRATDEGRFVISVDCTECGGVDDFWGVVAAELEREGILVDANPIAVRNGLQRARRHRPLYLLRRFDAMLVRSAGEEVAELLRHLHSQVEYGSSVVLTSVVPIRLHASAAQHGSSYVMRTIVLGASGWEGWKKQLGFTGSRPVCVGLAREHGDEAFLLERRQIIAQQIWDRTPTFLHRLLTHAAAGGLGLTRSTYPVDLLVQSGLLRDEGSVIVPADPAWGPVWRQNGNLFP